MNAKKCDRCGNYYEDYHVNAAYTEVINAVSLLNRDIKGHHYLQKTCDFCPDCAKKLIIFLGGNGESC